MIKLQCPKCGSSQVQTTAVDRWCRRCGFRGSNKFQFEKKPDILFKKPLASADND